MDYAAPRGWEQLASQLVGVRPTPAPRRGGRHECEPGWSWRPSMTDYDLWLVLSGRGRGVLNDIELPLRTGTLVLMRPGDTGDFRQDPADRLTVVFCHFDFVDPQSRKPIHVPPEWLPSRHIPVMSLAPLSELVQRVVRLARDPHPLRRLEADAVLMSALIEVYVADARARGHPVPYVDARLQEVIDLVRTQPRRRPSLPEAAAVAGLSPSHLSRLFSRQLGTSFRAFVVRTRLERAHHLLSETPMTVAEVAKALGYHDVFLFSRQFRQHYGLPPSRIRQTER